MTILSHQLRHAVVAAAVLVGLGACSASEANNLPDEAKACTGRRVVVVSLSSSERSPATIERSSDIVATDLAGAFVCDDDFVAIGVSGGMAKVLITSDDLDSINLSADSAKARLHRVQGRFSDVEDLVRERFNAALATDPGETTSVTRLYDVAAEHAVAGSRVVILTDGVHTEGDLDLNVVLEPGAGAALAALVTVPKIAPDVRIVVGGIGEVDAQTPPPGSTWIREVTEFNRALCVATDATCTIHTVATTTDLLQ